MSPIFIQLWKYRQEYFESRFKIDPFLSSHSYFSSYFKVLRTYWWFDGYVGWYNVIGVRGRLSVGRFPTPSLHPTVLGTRPGYGTRERYFPQYTMLAPLRCPVLDVTQGFLRKRRERRTYVTPRLPTSPTLHLDWYFVSPSLDVCSTEVCCST